MHKLVKIAQTLEFLTIQKYVALTTIPIRKKLQYSSLLQHIQSNHESTLSLNDQSNNIDIFATTEQTIKNKVIVPNLFENKDEVIAYVQSLNAEEAILLGNLWLQIKDKVTSLNHYEVILTANSEKEKAIREREIEVLNTKNKEIKELEKSISAKDRLILDNENKRKQSIEQLAKKEDEIKRYQASLQKKDDEIYTIRSSFNLERKELKLEKDKQLHEVQINISKQLPIWAMFGRNFVHLILPAFGILLKDY